MADATSLPESGSRLPESDPGAARAFAGTLEPGEDLVWTGRPDGRRFVRRDGRLIALGVFWTAVAGAGFWGFTANLLSDEFGGLPVAARVLVLLIAALPFLAVSVYCLGGHVLARRRIRARTAYAITAQRVLVRRPALRVVGPDVMRELPRDGVGEVIVEDLRHSTGSLDVHDASGVVEPLRLDTVAGAEAIAALLRPR